jgi:hypothetical protein
MALRAYVPLRSAIFDGRGLRSATHARDEPRVASCDRAVRGVLVLRKRRFLEHFHRIVFLTRLPGAAGRGASALGGPPGRRCGVRRAGRGRRVLPGPPVAGRPGGPHAALCRPPGSRRGASAGDGDLGAAGPALARSSARRCRVDGQRGRAGARPARMVRPRIPVGRRAMDFGRRGDRVRVRRIVLGVRRGDRGVRLLARRDARAASGAVAVFPGRASFAIHLLYPVLFKSLAAWLPRGLGLARAGAAAARAAGALLSIERPFQRLLAPRPRARPSGSLLQTR